MATVKAPKRLKNQPVVFIERLDLWPNDPSYNHSQCDPDQCRAAEGNQPNE